MSQIRNTSSRKTYRTSTLNTNYPMKNITSNLPSSSIKKDSRLIQTKILPGLNQPYQQQKYTLRQQNSNLNFIEKQDLLKDSTSILDNDNKIRQAKDKNKFRIRDSRRQQTPLRLSEEEQRQKQMEESIKRKDKAKQDKEKQELSKIKTMQLEMAESVQYNQDIQQKTINKKKRLDFSSKTLGLVGLTNIGNTCFMNSILQCMFNIPDFNDYFLQNKHKSEAKTNSKVPTAYAKTIQLIRSSTSRSETPSELKNAIGAKKSRFMGYSQQDAQQFLAALLELLSSELNRAGTPKYRQLKADPSKHTLKQISQQWWNYNKERQDSIVCDFFTGQMLSKVVCSNCNHESIAFDNTWDYALNFSEGDRGQIPLMFKNFLSEQTIADDYYCSKCKGFHECKRKFDFYRLPKVLVCQLKRFSYGRWRKVKLNNRIKVNLILDLAPLIKQSRHASVKNPVYDLIGVVNHSGDIDFGHYTAQCKNPLNEKCEIWKGDSFESSSPYLLFYYKRD